MHHSLESVVSRFEDDAPPKEVPLVLLVGSGSPRIHPYMLEKLLAMDRDGAIVLTYQSLEVEHQPDYSSLESRVERLWIDELHSLGSTPYIITGGELVKRKVERKPKPFYRKGERW